MSADSLTREKINYDKQNYAMNEREKLRKESSRVKKQVNGLPYGPDYNDIASSSILFNLGI